jgi:restriction system protein
MAIPDYQSLMLPLLRLLEDGQEHTAREAIDKLADQFNLTDQSNRRGTQSAPSKWAANRFP